MQHKGCKPDSVTFGGLISAYDRAGRLLWVWVLVCVCVWGAGNGRVAAWRGRRGVFGCARRASAPPPFAPHVPPPSTAHRQCPAGHWRRALTAYEQMKALNCRPDSVVYNTIVGALWKTGLVWAQAKAAHIFHAACRQGHFRLTVHTLDPARAGRRAREQAPATHVELHLQPHRALQLLLKGCLQLGAAPHHALVLLC